MLPVKWFYMKGKISLAVSALAVVSGVWMVTPAQPNAPGREVRIKGGRTAIDFLPANLKRTKLDIAFSKTLDANGCSTCNLPGFQIEDADLSFRLVNGQLTSFDGGEISHRGSFTLKSGDKTISSDRLTIASNKSTGELSLSVDSSKGSIVAFDLRSPRKLHKSNAQEVVLQDMEVVISDELAYEMGDPELRGTMVGSVTLYAQSEQEDGGEIEVAETSPAAVGLDISLSAMSSLAVASNPTAKVGTYPNGRTGLTMSTTSCNVGTVNVPWNAPMQTTHPVIALNLYRLLDGKFEQVGWSWLKHGFLSTNSNGCGSCQNPGTGSLLGLNCSDTYGTGNNGDRNYLGARDEVNPFTGVWTCQGSWFSNYINDCTRRNPGQVTLDAVDHRIDCLDSDLGNPNARYFYEAYYIASNDVNTYNNLGSREATLSWGGSSWSISTTTAMVTGPAINRWGELRNTATPTTEGDAIVAVQTTSLGNGMWRYDYALYNHNLDRQVRQFSVPLPYGATVQNIGFRDIDRDANNSWAAVQSDHALTWSTTAFGGGSSNPLKYSSVFNFRFDTNVPPASNNGTLGLYKPGTLQSLSAASKGPLFLSPPSSITLVNGAQIGGNLASLEDDDNDGLTISPTAGGARSGTGIIGSTFAPAAAITQIDLGVRSSNTLITGNGAEQAIELWNWNTSAYELVDTRPATLTETLTSLTLTNNPARFVHATTREVRFRIQHNTDIGGVGNRWSMTFDLVGFHFN